jgi:hypothetical protein
MVHVDPSHCSMSAPFEAESTPTATQLVLLEHETLLSDV